MRFLMRFMYPVYPAALSDRPERDDSCHSNLRPCSVRFFLFSRFPATTPVAFFIVFCLSIFDVNSSLRSL